MCGTCGCLSNCSLTAEQGFVLNNVKWGGGSNGTSGGTVTWSLADTNFSSVQPFDFSGVLTGDFATSTSAAFDAWEAVADIDFVQVSDASDVDIRLGFASIDGANGTLGTASTRFFSDGELTQAHVRFDDAETWGHSTNSVLTDGSINFYTVALHEIGHAIGIGHSEATPAIMEAFLNDALFSSSLTISPPFKPFTAPVRRKRRPANFTTGAAVPTSFRVTAARIRCSAAMASTRSSGVRAGTFSTAIRRTTSSTAATGPTHSTAVRTTDQLP